MDLYNAATLWVFKPAPVQILSMEVIDQEQLVVASLNQEFWVWSLTTKKVVKKASVVYNISAALTFDAHTLITADMFALRVWQIPAF